MSTQMHLLIFFFILFLYIHISHQYKRSEDLEIYEMDYSCNSHLQEVCDIKQPVLFDYKSQNPTFFGNVTLDKLESHGSQDVKVKEISDYYSSEQIDSIDYVVLPFQSFNTLIGSDTKSKYFTENNDSFIDDSDLSREFQKNDALLKPYMTIQTKYDILMGSKDVITPLRYHTCYRNFISVNSGKIQVKMTPWKSSKYLSPVTDYDNYEFFSRVNVWKPQRNYMHEMDKLKFLEFTVNEGFMLYIPPFWWYSIKFLDSNETIVSSFTYNSIMNCVANLPKWTLYYMQQSNIKKNITKTLDISTIETVVSQENKEDNNEPSKL